MLNLFVCLMCLFDLYNIRLCVFCFIWYWVILGFMVLIISLYFYRILISGVIPVIIFIIVLILYIIPIIAVYVLTIIALSSLSFTLLPLISFTSFHLSLSTSLSSLALYQTMTLWSLLLSIPTLAILNYHNYYIIFISVVLPLSPLSP